MPNADTIDRGGEREEAKQFIIDNPCMDEFIQNNFAMRLINGEPDDNSIDLMYHWKEMKRIAEGKRNYYE